MGRPKKLTQDQVEMIQNDQTKSIQDWIDIFGCSRATIINARMRRGAYSDVQESPPWNIGNEVQDTQI